MEKKEQLIKQNQTVHKVKDIHISIYMKFSKQGKNNLPQVETPFSYRLLHRAPRCYDIGLQTVPSTMLS